MPYLYMIPFFVFRGFSRRGGRRVLGRRGRGGTPAGPPGGPPGGGPP